VPPAKRSSRLAPRSPFRAPSPAMHALVQVPARRQTMRYAAGHATPAVRASADGIGATGACGWPALRGRLDGAPLSDRADQFRGERVPTIVQTSGCGERSMCNALHAFEARGAAVPVLAGPNAITLPIRMWQGLRLKVNPLVAAVSTLEFVLS